MKSCEITSLEHFRDPVATRVDIDNLQKEKASFTHVNSPKSKGTRQSDVGLITDETPAY